MLPRRPLFPLPRFRSFLLVPSLLLTLGLFGCSRSGPSQTQSVDSPQLTPQLASRLVRLSLDCVDRPWPNKPGHILDGDSALRPPSELTPAFFGCFDWHSAVHGHWAMLRVLRHVPAIPEHMEIRRQLDAHFTVERLQKEKSFFALERNRTFERPYGIGWLLRLTAELHSYAELDPSTRRWEDSVAPLAQLLGERFSTYLSRLSVPVRAGTHDNTAYAMIHAIDYASVVKNESFRMLLIQRAKDFYLADRACPVPYEPSGEDFISPCLVEADLMRRVLSPSEFAHWLGAFLPRSDTPEFARLRTPIAVRDRHDPRIGHLIGLSFQRAAALRGIARSLPKGHPEVESLERIAAVHAKDGLTQMTDSGYGGEHWLASFALYLLTNVGM